MDGRERMVAEGPQGLSELELLSVLLGTGSKGLPATAVAAHLLTGGLGELRRARVRSLVESPGVGEAQACRVIAGLELGRRAAYARSPERRRLLNPGALAERLWIHLAHLPHEEFWVLLLNSRCEELRAQRISLGGLTHCSVLPREALAPALVHGAPLCAFAHNHPSGDPRPSADDQRLQLLLDEAARSLGIQVVDHLVIADGGVHSAQAGLLPPPPPPQPEEAPEPDEAPRCAHTRSAEAGHV
jgi:DNA repair protein RadC